MRDTAGATPLRHAETDAEGHRREPRLTLETLAVRTGVPPRTILYYERFGLVAGQDGFGTRRLYSESDVEHIRRIRRLIDDLGVNLAGVAAILHLREQVLALRRQLHGEPSPRAPRSTAHTAPFE